MDSQLPPSNPAESTPEIRNREDFARTLAATITEVDARAAREPAYPIWTNLQRQLHAMREWTAHGRNPTPTELGRISIGLVAARELEPAADATMESLITRLHLLNYYWRRWPSAQAAVLMSPPLLKDVAAAGRHARPTVSQGWIRYPPRGMMILLLVSLLLFIAACSLPALEFRNSHKPNDTMYGLHALAYGWTGVFAGVFAWYANPCWFFSLVLGFFRRPLAAALMGVLAIILAATTFSLVGRELPGDEGNVTRTTIIRLLPGCHLWMGAVGVLPLAAFLRSGKARPGI